MNAGKLLIAAGIIIFIVGLFLTWGGKIPFLGRLPGDIRIERGNFSFYFPLATSILVSLLLTFLFWLFRR